jgi:pimeloyl-ACP methyl ester carboxylesterase
LKLRRPRWWLVALLVLACAAAVTALALPGSGRPKPGPFYAVPSPLPPGPPGTLIRSQPIPHLYPGAKSYRILYKSTGLDGRPTAVSGVVVVPEAPGPARGRDVVAFTHGTVGIARDCAPSLQRGGIAQVIEGIGEFVAAGYVVSATDYQGLGTPGPHPYLVGRVAAMNALDSVRAAHRLRQAHAGVRFAVWGHSQGGQAALFTGQLARTYAPGLHLVGVAAGAPVPSLEAFFRVNRKTTAGKLLLALTLGSWSAVYRAPALLHVLAPASRPAVAQIAGYCLAGGQSLAAAPSAAALGLKFQHLPRWRSEPWRKILVQNTPGTSAIDVPILITQGGGDKVVPAALTVRFARRLCERGETVDVRLYPGVENEEAGIVVVPDVLAWIGGRFAGRPAPDSCR